MIPYADLEFAIDRWKARAAGVPQPAPTAASGMVVAEVPVSTAPEEAASEEAPAEDYAPDAPVDES